MQSITNLLPGGKKKALTLSYDDGVTQDRQLLNILNKYDIKCTFNLNSGLIKRGYEWHYNDVRISKLKIDELQKTYEGHEIAVHSYNHPHLEILTNDQLVYEIYEDRKTLETWFNRPIRGMAYPFGSFNQHVQEVINNLGIEYARTAKSTGKFDFPNNLLEWNPTSHHDSQNILELVNSFLKKEPTDLPLLFYLWGHSYEFEVNNNWGHIEKICSVMANNPDIWYATNQEIVYYYQALKNLKYSLDGNHVYNPSGLSIWILKNNHVYKIQPGEVVTL